MQVIMPKTTHAICGAKKRNGTPCQNPPVTGRNRCRMHGGATLMGEQSGTYKTGAYSKYLPKSIKDKVEHFQTLDPFDVLPELELQRALLATYAERFEQTGFTLTAGDINILMEWLTTITRTVERIVRMKNDTALSGAEITYLALRATEVVMRYVDEPDRQAAFINDLFGDYAPANVIQSGDETSGG